MAWDYAELSHMAKEAGGPGLLLETVKAGARNQGRIEGAGIGALAVTALFACGAFLYGQYRKSKVVAGAAASELIEGINAYDAANEGESMAKDSVVEGAAANQGDQEEIHSEGGDGNDCAHG